MTSNMTTLKKATIAGLVPALIEGALLQSFEPGMDGWYFTQAVSFWFTCGFVVYLAVGNLPAVPSAILLTVFLNVPWFIEEAIRPGRYDHILPLLVASVVSGVVIGLVSRKLRTPSRAQPLPSS